MKYKLIQRINPKDVQSPKKWYALPVNNGLVSVEEMAQLIALRSSLTPGDVYNVIYNLYDAIPDYIEEGRSVSLGVLGKMRGSFSSKGIDDPKKYNARLITKKRIIFTPGVAIKKRLKTMKVEKE
ncbi:MAG: DNA-binding protein [Bacteroidales bacterium]|jgi:predicted histone-like DNA-binding protein|nr:DNA-binding protein [Bacteroidales bacterium]